MKNELAWTSTILTVYKYLERICGAIDKIIMQRALGSTNIVGQNYFYNNTLAVSEKIIDLSERKITLINLKVLIEETLAEINQNDAQILIYKYVDCLRHREIADACGVGLRTIFRKTASAEATFKSRLCSKGYNDIKLKDMLRNEGWINNIYSNLVEKDNGFEISNAYLARAVSM